MHAKQHVMHPVMKIGSKQFSTHTNKHEMHLRAIVVYSSKTLKYKQTFNSFNSNDFSTPMSLCIPLPLHKYISVEWK